jgi:hypothetical protein
VRKARLAPHLLDAAVACSLAVVVAILIAGRQESAARDPDLLAFVAGVAVAEPLLVRRRCRSLSSLEATLAEPGPAPGRYAVGANEPPVPGKLTTDQAIGLTKAIAKGRRDRFRIMREAIAAAARELRDAPGTLD